MSMLIRTQGQKCARITDSCATWIKYTRCSWNIYLTLCKVITWDEWWMSPVIFQLTAGNVSLKPGTLISNYCRGVANLSPADDKMGWQRWKASSVQDVRIGHNSIKARCPLGQLCRVGSRTSRPPAAKFIISVPRPVNYPHRAPTSDS